MSQIVGTPDWQRAVVASQKLLDYVANPGTTATVGVPPNAETIIVVAGNNPGLGTLTALGGTSGVYYAVNQYIQRISGEEFGEYFINVSAQVDQTLILTWTLAPGTGFWVYSDQATHVSFDPNVGELLQISANAPGAHGIAMLGTDGTLHYEVLTDSSGRLQVVISNMPNPATTVVGPDAYGDPAVVGVSADYARGDHDHGLPAASSSAPLSVTQYGPTTDPAYAISTTAMTAIDTTNLTTQSFTVPASGRIKVTVAGTIQGTMANGSKIYLAMLNHTGGSQVGDTKCVNGYALLGVGYYNPFATTYLITGLSAGSLQLDLALFASAPNGQLGALVTAPPAETDIGPITILVEAA